MTSGRLPPTRLLLPRPGRAGSDTWVELGGPPGCRRTGDGAPGDVPAARTERRLRKRRLPGRSGFDGSRWCVGRPHLHGRPGAPRVVGRGRRRVAQRSRRAPRRARVPQTSRLRPREAARGTTEGPVNRGFRGRTPMSSTARSGVTASSPAAPSPRRSPDAWTPTGTTRSTAGAADRKMVLHIYTVETHYAVAVVVAYMDCHRRSSRSSGPSCRMQGIAPPRARTVRERREVTRAAAALALPEGNVDTRPNGSRALGTSRRSWRRISGSAQPRWNSPSVKTGPSSPRPDSGGGVVFAGRLGSGGVQRGSGLNLHPICTLANREPNGSCRLSGCKPL